MMTMNTIIEKVDHINPDINIIKKAANIIKSGGLAAFPTETVYGLGGDAFNESAVQKIYSVKGRPFDNPLIVHITELDSIYSLIDVMPDMAARLAESFWPGPLTMVFKTKKGLIIPASRGMNTIAVRMPSHAVFRRLIEQAGPIAAPSANSSGKPSPTRASHVEYDLHGKIDIILDGGAALYGLESTVVDVTGDIPCLLRPGSVTREMLLTVAGKLNIDDCVFTHPNVNSAPKAPGMKYKHYSPLANVVIVQGKLESIINKINELAGTSQKKTGILATDQTSGCYDNDKYTVLSVGDRDKPETIAADLFNSLRKFDYLGVEVIYAEGLPEDELGLAIMNRLIKAAGYEIIKV